MRDKLLLFLCALIGSVSVINGQCNTFHSSHTEDQMTQRPCYVFATAAVLETVSGDNIDLSEWYLWSTCVLEGATGNGLYIIDAIADHVNDIGALYEQDFYDPFGQGGLGCLSGQGNPANSRTPCIFLYEGAQNKFCQILTNNDCPVGLQLGFEAGVCNFAGHSWETHFPESFRSGQVSVNSLNVGDLTNAQKEQVLDHKICAEETGVVLFLKDYRPIGSSDNPTFHAVDAFRKNGILLTYKDS